LAQKYWQKMHEKLTPSWLNFVIILQAVFFVRKYFAQLFSTYSLALLFFWGNNISAKAAGKM